MHHHPDQARPSCPDINPPSSERAIDLGDVPTPAASSPRLRPVCGRCGSDALVRDACAVWSIPEQRWELAGTYDSTTCQHCEAEADDLADWHPLSDSMPAGVAAPDGVAMLYHPGTGTLLAVDEAVLVHLGPATDDDEDEEIAARLHAAGASTPLAHHLCIRGATDA